MFGKKKNAVSDSTTQDSIRSAAAHLEEQRQVLSRKIKESEERIRIETQEIDYNTSERNKIEYQLNSLRSRCKHPNRWQSDTPCPDCGHDAPYYGHPDGHPAGLY